MHQLSLHICFYRTQTVPFILLYQKLKSFFSYFSEEVTSETINYYILHNILIHLRHIKQHKSLTLIFPFLSILSKMTSTKYTAKENYMASPALSMLQPKMASVTCYWRTCYNFSWNFSYFAHITSCWQNWWWENLIS